MTDTSNYADTIDVRELIERFEELSADHDGDNDTGGEYAGIKTLLDELRGNGGDVQWHGDWYPLTLVRDSHWRDYTEEYADDLVPDSSSWPYTCIDWDAAGRDLQQDYTSVDYDGVTYWYR